jgi:hypothetical protein
MEMNMSRYSSCPSFVNDLEQREATSVSQKLELDCCMSLYKNTDANDDMLSPGHLVFGTSRS